MKPELSIVLPCRNEEKAIGFCIHSIKKVLKEHNIQGEIIVSDSSIDNSPVIARKLGAQVIKHNKKGYGIACLEGCKAAKGSYIILADADGTYDFNNIPKFLHYLYTGYDFVIGNRFKGSIQKGAMPFLHRYIGNPLLSGLLKLFFNAKINDAHCGMRAITKKALDKLNLKTTGMEFASEMVLKAVQEKLRIKEIPINYHKRKEKSKLNSFSDGWRHLRFMLMYAPNYLFILPGISLILLGTMIMTLLLMGPIKINDFTLYTHPMIIGSFLTIVGYQIVNLGVYARTYAISTGLKKKDTFVDLLAKYITFESGVMLGAIIILISLILGLHILLGWISEGFPALSKINNLIVILTLGVIGVQTLFSSFFLSIMLIEKK